MKKLMLSLAMLMSFIGCNKYKNGESTSVEIQDMELENAILPEVEGKVFSTQASISMKVKDAFKTGNEIQENVIQSKGYVLSNHFRTQIVDSESLNIAADSVKKMDKVIKYNDLTIKVPVHQLPNHLKYAMEKGVIIHSVQIENDELTFDKLKNDLELKENTKAKISHQIDEKVNKEIIGDKISYATVGYQLEQEPVFVTYHAPRTDLKVYKEINLGLELKNSIYNGWYYLKMFILIVVQLLPTLFVVFLVIYGFKKARKAFKNREIRKTN